MTPFHYASCSVVAAIRGRQRHVADWQYCDLAVSNLGASFRGSSFLRSSLNQLGTAVQAVADIDSDAHTEVRVVEPSLDANDPIYDYKAADISPGQGK